MKLRYILLTVAAAVLVASCDDTSLKPDNKTVADLQAQIDALTGSTIPDLQTQAASINATIESLKATDTQVQAYADALKDQLEAVTASQQARQSEADAIKAQIDALQNAHKAIQEKIATLKNYVDTQLSSQKDWAKGTFATLEQFNSLSDAVAALKVSYEAFKKELDAFEGDIIAACTKALDEAVKQLEADMTSWINTQLAGYYTIAQTKEKLSAIEKKCTDADADLKTQIDEQKKALDKAKEDLTKAYTDAIGTAITTLEGKLNEKIATDILTMNEDVQLLIDDANELVEGYDEKIAELEESVSRILNRVQSIVVVPTFSDGSVKVEQSAEQLFTFDVMPAGVLDSLVNKASADFADNFKLVLTRTQTKAKAADPEITVCGAEVNESGQLVLTADVTKLGKSFFAGKVKLSASLVIETKDGMTSKSSKYFGLYTEPAPVYTEGSYSGNGIKVDGIWWAPVNCGYDATHTFGLLYQWGRKYGQAFEAGAITPETLTKDEGENPANSGKFGLYDGTTYNWFSGAVDNTLWTENSKGTYDPCPDGWRVPTKSEFEALVSQKAWGSNTVGVVPQTGYWFNGSSTASVGTGVFFPVAGIRPLAVGEVSDRGDVGRYWSSSVDSEYASSLGFSEYNIGIESHYRADGFSVRCVKE